MDDLTRALVAVAEGDQDAMPTFVRLAQADVWRFCAHMVDVGSADDLTQDTFVRAIRSAPGFRAESTARTWLFAIARRVCADEIRRRQRVRRRQARLEAEEPANIEDDAQRHELVDLLSRLTPDRREVFALTQLFGLSYAETSEALDVPVGTVRSRLARARADLVAGWHGTRSEEAAS